MSPTDTPYIESLYDLLYACQKGQRVAIVGSHTDDNPLRNQLYVEQKEDEEVANFFDTECQDDGKLLILTGSAGDGKSALLVRGYDLAGGEIPPERVNMDATEARRRDSDYEDRLTSYFGEIYDEIVDESGPRSALAINYGLAVDYFERRDTPDQFQFMWDVLQSSQTKPFLERDNIQVINLSHRRTYETHPEELGEGLVREIIERFDPSSEESPFKEAYEWERENCPAGEDCILQYNITQLKRPVVKDQLARLLAGWSIVTGSYLNPRTILDHISSFVLPTGLQELPAHDVCPVGKAIEQEELIVTESDIFWNSVFETLGTEHEQEASIVDPTSYTSFETDQQVLKMATDVEKLKSEHSDIPETAFESAKGIVRTVLRKQYLTTESGETILDDEAFDQFTAALTYFNEDLAADDLRSQTEQFLNTTRKALGSWTGGHRDDELVEFVDGNRSSKYRYLSKWDQPNFDPGKSAEETKALAVPGRIKLLTVPPEDSERGVPIPLSFDTYRLMTQISQGYVPNATDLNQSHAIQMLHARLDDFTNKRQQVFIESRSGSRKITIEDSELGVSVSSEGIE